MLARLKHISNDFLSQLKKVEANNLTTMDCANNSIILCQKTLTKLKKEITQNDFKTIENEIEFFKSIKQITFVPLIYYSEVRSFELQFPKTNFSSKKKYLKKKMAKINRFFLYNIDFGRYVSSNAVHFDKEYFTRDYSETFHITTSKFYFQDPEFCTPRDMLLGKYKAYDSLIIYLDKKKHRITNKHNNQLNIASPIEKIDWPFSNTEYVELLYALYSKGLGKRDNQSLMQVSKKLQQLFQIQPKDIYKTFQDIKNRKISRTLFLDQLSTSLLLEMDKSEE